MRYGIHPPPEGRGILPTFLGKFSKNSFPLTISEYSLLRSIFNAQRIMSSLVHKLQPLAADFALFARPPSHFHERFQQW